MEEKNTSEQKTEQPTGTLQPKTVGALKKQKERKSNIIVFIMLGLFIALVFYLPEVSKFLGGVAPEIDPDDKSSQKIALTDNNKEFFLIKIDSKINLDNHQFTGFEIDQETTSLKFKVTNLNEERTSTSNKDLYITFYDEGKNLIYYRPIESQILKPDTPTDLVATLKSEQIALLKYIKIGEMREEDYPAITLNKDVYGTEYLTCISGNLKYTYYFVDNKIIKINEYYSGTKVSLPDTYEIIYQTYKSKYDGYRSDVSFTPTFNDTFNGFTFQTDIDLSLGNYTNMDKNYLPKDTTTKAANFLMESRRFDCQ